MDKSKENIRIAEIKALSADDLNLLITAGINNPSILKQFLAEVAAAAESEEEEESSASVKWEYAVAAGLLDWDDIAKIKADEAAEAEATDEPSVVQG